MSHNILHVVIEHPVNVFPTKGRFENPQLATAKWSNQRYGKQTQVRPRLDPGHTWTRFKPMTTSLNEGLPSYPYQALPAPSMATDYCGKHRCSIIDWNSSLKRCTQAAAATHGRLSQRGRRCHQELSCHTGKCMLIHCAQQWQT